MTEDDELFGPDDDLPAWMEEDQDDVPEELDGLDDEGLLDPPP